jgi:hypothetical protein
MVNAVAFCPTGKVLASGGDDNNVVLWEAATGKELHKLQGPKDGIGALAFSPDGRVLASASNGTKDQSLWLWETATGKPLHRIQRGYCDTSSLAFSPDGRSVAVASGEQAVDLWDVATGQKRLTFAKQRGWWVKCVVFSPDGNFLAVGIDNDVCLWSVLTGAEVHRFTGHRGGISCLDFGPDGKTLISGCSDTTALVWDVAAATRGWRVQPRQLGPGEAETLWADLAAADTGRAYRALRTLVAAPRQAVAFLKEHLRAARTLDAGQEKQVGRWIGELDSTGFAVRRKAFRGLEELGEVVGPALRKALAGRPSAEARKQLKQLLAGLGGPPRWRETRAVEVLERTNTPEARQLLATLAQGESGVRLTQEARAALERVNRK